MHCSNHKQIEADENDMKILTVYANPNPRSFCHAILQEFSRGLEEAGHANDVVDLYAIRFNPVLKLWYYVSRINGTNRITGAMSRSRQIKSMS